jgi:hypothetical protein
MNKRLEISPRKGSKGYYLFTGKHLPIVARIPHPESRRCEEGLLFIMFTVVLIRED